MVRAVDDIDEGILLHLGRNARMSLDQLAGKVGLSRNAVRQRVERLERDGLILAYTIVRGAVGSEVGAPFAAVIFVYRHDRMRGGEVVKALKAFSEVVACDVLSGDFDLMVRVEARSADRIRMIWQEIASMPGVRDTVTSFVLSGYKAKNGGGKDGGQTGDECGK